MNKVSPSTWDRPVSHSTTEFDDVSLVQSGSVRIDQSKIMSPVLAIPAQHEPRDRGVQREDPGPANKSPGSLIDQVIRILRKYVTFIGPGFIIAVSYIDPGNYSTDVAA